MINNAFLKILLYPFYLIYLFLINARNFLYDAGIFKAKKANKKVISVGNLTVGGTGKTPFTVYLSEKLLDEFALKPCVLTRGYKRKSDSRYLVVEQNMSFVECGDEPLLIKNRLKDRGCVLVGKNRYKSSVLFGEKCGCDVFVLDDGYQHRKLHRDLNICLVDCTNPFGNGKLVPFGILREPVKELKRAHIIVLTRAKYASNITLLRKTVESLNKMALVFEANLEISHFFVPATGKIVALEDIHGKTAIAFSAIGNPLSFKADLVTAGIDVKRAFSFRDHALPSPEKLEKIRSVANEENADFVVTTEKDWVKLKEEEKLLEIFGKKLIICISNLLLSKERDFLKFMEEILNDKRIT